MLEYKETPSQRERARKAQEEPVKQEIDSEGDR